MKQYAHQDTSFDDDALERLEKLYDALGLGFPPEGLVLFGGDTSELGVWSVSRRGRKLGYVSSSEVSNDELFALPPAWEIMRVVVHTVGSEHTRRGDVVSVAGHLYCRPRGSWASERFPFLHIWTMCAGRALRFEDFLDGVELKRTSRLEGCPPAS